MKTPRTLQEAIRYFSDPAVCFEFVVQLRWPDGVVCPTCGSREVGFVASRNLFQCKAKHPKRQFSVKVGTIFEDSPIGLDKWLAGIWLIGNAKNSISSYEIGRALGITQKSAWFLLHRIRLAMQTESFETMAGPVEADETFIGGKARFMHKDKKAAKVKGTGGTGSGKVAVMGPLERHGSDKPSRVRAKVVANTCKKTVQAEVVTHVEPGAEPFTDALASSSGLDREYIHAVIDHAEAYARGNVHTNGIENFWSLPKRTIKGTYVSVEPYHLFRYLDEQAFRFNERKDRAGDGGRPKKVAGQVVGKRLTYRNLTGKTLDLSGIDL